MRRAALLIILLVVFGVLSYWCYRQAPWIDVAASVQSQRGSIDCGHASEPDARAAEAAIDCAMSARKSARPFVVVFSVHGVDEGISNAVGGFKGERYRTVLCGKGQLAINRDYTQVVVKRRTEGALECKRLITTVNNSMLICEGLA